MTWRIGGGVFSFRRPLMFVVTRAVALLTPFIGVECNRESTTVLGSYAEKIDRHIRIIDYRIIISLPRSF